MKKLAVLLLMLAGVVHANPYVYTPFTKGYQYNLSEGALFDSHFSNPIAATDLAVFYHPLSSGSVLPSSWQEFIPPESWSINCGGGAGNGISYAGCGPSINLLDSARAWTSNILMTSSNPNFQAAAAQIAPGVGPLSILVTYQPSSQLIVNGQFGKNPFKFTNHWFIGPKFSF
jgi:hypothetical protein